MYFDFAEIQSKRGILMYIKDRGSKLVAYLKFHEHEILKDAGKVSHEVAQTLALKEHEIDKREQDIVSAFENASFFSMIAT